MPGRGIPMGGGIPSPGGGIAPGGGIPCGGIIIGGIPGMPCMHQNLADGAFYTTVSLAWPMTWHLFVLNSNVLLMMHIQHQYHW